MVKHLHKYLILFALLVPALALAQVKVTIKAPSQAEVGQRFTVSYTVNTQDVEDFDVGDFNGFDVLFGPSTSRQSSFSIVNGKQSHTSTLTLSYTLSPTKEGTFRLPALTVTSDGKKYTSNTASVQVLPNTGGSQGSSGGQSSGSSRQPATRQRTQDAGESITSKDLFVTVTASKTRVYEQEAVLLSYKLYTLVSIDQASGKMPELDGFHVQEIDLPQQKSLKYETHNGRNYGTVLWSQYVVFPQKTGKLTIPALPFDIEVVQQDRSLDPFDAFFGGGSSLVHVQKKVMAPAVNIEVLPLPAKPAGFSGAVGKGFSIKGTLSPQQVDANDAAQLNVTVSGSGNLQLMSAPQVNWPKDFEVYDPKQTDKTKLSTSGSTGTVQYAYTVVPRHGGKFSIAPVEFVYFDTDVNQYRTLRTDSFQLAVANVVGNKSGHVNREDLKVLDSDIRYIMTGNRGTHQQGSRFFASAPYILSYPLALLFFCVAAFVFYHRGKMSANVEKRRGKRAGKAASKRLKTARLLQKKNQREQFYDEVMRALWGYVADKLGLPVADLNKDNVRQLLTERGVGENTLESFFSVLENCEFARFAPGAVSATMEQTLDEATDVINKIEAAL